MRIKKNKIIHNVKNEIVENNNVKNEIVENNNIEATINHYLNNGITKLHLGCGSQYHDGYINIDFPEEKTIQQRLKKPDIETDFTKINFPTEKFDEIMFYHVFEHFQRHEAVGLLCIFNRILKNSGICKIAVPDIFACINIFLESPYVRKKEIIRHMWGSHEDFWATHQEGWYEDNLIECFNSCGFEPFHILKNGTKWPQIVIQGKKISKPNMEKIILFLKDYDAGDSIIPRWINYIQSIFNKNQEYYS